MLTGMERIARVALSDLAAAMLNEDMIDGARLMELASRSAGPKSTELMRESRVLVWEKNGRRAAFGMSVGDDEAALALERLGAIPSGANFYDPVFGVKILSVADIARKSASRPVAGRRKRARPV